MAKEDLKNCNLDYLYDLAKGDMGFVREMIDVFVSDNSGELDNLESEIKSKNFPEIKHISHKLRSSIPYVGLDKLIGEEVAEIEELAKNEKDIAKIARLYKKVREVSDKAITELTTYKI